MNQEKKIDDGGPFHSIVEKNLNAYTVAKHEGITRRDWLAGLAMQGWLSTWGPTDNSPGVEGVSRFAYKMADAMIAEGKKNGN